MRSEYRTLDLIHAKIHGLRMIPNYKPSTFEKELNELIADEYQDQCRECRNKLKALRLKQELKEIEPVKEKSSFLGGMFKE